SRMPTRPCPVVHGTSGVPAVASAEPSSTMRSDSSAAAYERVTVTTLSNGPVLARIRQGLLHDPVGGQVQAGRQRDRITLDMEVHTQARLPGLVDESLETAEAGLRGPRRAAVVAEHIEHPPHLPHRVAPRVTH